VTSFPGEESGMIAVECITALFSEVDEQMDAIPTHPEAYLWPSESVLVYDSIIAQVTDNMLNEVQG
jgi:hypothetical protein